MHGSSHTSVAAALSLAGPGVSTRRVQVTSAPGPTSFGACCPPGDPCPQAPLSDGGTLGICSAAAAAIAKSLQSDSVRPHRWQPTRLLCPWDSPGKNTGVGCHFLLQVCAQDFAALFTNKNVKKKKKVGGLPWCSSG